MIKNTLFQELHDRLTTLEVDRQMVEVNLGEAFDVEWGMEDKNTPSAIITLGSDLLMTKKAFFQLIKLMNHYMGTSPIAGKYLWNYPDVITQKMPEHLADYKVRRSTSAKRDHDRIKLMLHGTTITAVMSSNYVDYSNLTLLDEFIKVCGANNLELKRYTYTLDEFGDEMVFIPIFEQFTEGENLYGAGVRISNSQNKTGGLFIAPVTLSTICNNSIMSWFTIYHRHDANIAEFASKQLMATPYLIELAVDTYHNYMEALDILIDPGDMDNILNYITKRFVLSKRHVLKLQEGFTSEFDAAEGTLFGLVSGITYLVNFLDYGKVDEGKRLLRFAGQLLTIDTDNGVVTFNGVSEL